MSNFNAEKVHNYQFMADTSISLGAADAKVIPASDVVVENRVALKCRQDVSGMGKN